MNYANFGLEKNVEILSAHHVERFTPVSYTHLTLPTTR